MLFVIKATGKQNRASELKAGSPCSIDSIGKMTIEQGFAKLARQVSFPLLFIVETRMSRVFAGPGASSY